MDNIINVLDSIIKNKYVLKDVNNKIIYPHEDIQIKYFNNLLKNNPDVLNTFYDIVNKKWIAKKEYNFIYNNNYYILDIFINKTNDVKAYKKREFELYVDSLTDVYRREMTYFKADEYIKKAIINKESFALISTDIDNFKIINDTYGHYMGDKVLRIVAQTLLRETRQRNENDIVGRIGGDEFFILLKNIQEKNVLKRLNIINNKITNNIKDLNNEMNVTCSFGICYVTKDKYNSINNISEFREILYNNADKALYESKKTGKNKISIYKNTEN
jgi:diguanylate cyclase (GGDEF)-like protein